MTPADRGIRIDESICRRGSESQAVIMRKNPTAAANAAIIEKGTADRSEIVYIVMSAFIANDRLPRCDIAVRNVDRTTISASYRRFAAFEQRQTSIWRAMLQRKQARGLRSPQHEQQPFQSNPPLLSNSRERPRIFDPDLR